MKHSASAIVVLVVEDEVLILLDTAESLKGYGFEVIEACDADIAIQLLEGRDDVALMFTDVNMPGSMDGLKLARTVQDRWPEIQIIVTSGKPVPETQRLPAKGRFFAKPYQTDEVASVMQTLLAA